MALLKTNTGIGTTNPTSALHVFGDGRFAGVVTAISFNGTLTGNVNTSGILTATGGFNIGIQSGGAHITTGVITAINFVGSGNSISYNPSTKIVDVSISGSGSGTNINWNTNSDFGLISDPATLASDLGLITDSSTESYNLGLVATEGPVYPTQFVLPSFTISTLPSASPVGQMLFVTDETGGSIPAFSDGTNWRRVTDAQIVS